MSTAFDRPLLFFIDEGQELAAQRNFAPKILRLRNKWIYLVAGFQNPSEAPIEWIANSSLLGFQLIDWRDREVFGNAAGLSRAQKEFLAQLDRGMCVCFLPGLSAWKSAFLTVVPEVAFSTPSESIAAQSKAFLSRFAWKPLGEITTGQDAGEREFDQATERFLRDVLIQAHLQSGITERFERAGIRSASKQGKTIRDLCAGGWIKVWPLAIGRGRPLKLVEPTEKALEHFGVSWKKTRGSLPTRVATQMLEKKFRSRLGWTCVLEGQLVGKQVDLLLRDERNRVVCVEVENSVEHCMHNALHCLSCDEVRKHVVVCLTKKGLDAVKQKFAGFTELAGNERVEPIMLSRALGEGWMP